jgi:rod shape-determining protein MreD
VSGRLTALLRMALVLFVLLLVQYTVGLNLRVAGVHPDLLVLLPVTAGLAAGPEEGCLVGFVTGVAADLFLAAPFGLSALVFCLVGFGVGAGADLLTASLAVVDRDAWWTAALAAAAGSVVAVMLYAVLGALLGQEQMLHLPLGAIAAVVAVVNAVLAYPVLVMVRWGLAPVRADERRHLGSVR